MKLQLGFENHAYNARFTSTSPLLPSVKKRAAKKQSAAQLAYGQGKSTGQVATDLEARYHVVETFYNIEEDNLIIPMLEEDFREALDVEMSGTPVLQPVTPTTLEKIEQRFRRNLSGRRYDGVIRGVPTLSAQRGISHLRQKPGAARGSRPSFIDTGMYQRSFKAWVE